MVWLRHKLFVVYFRWLGHTCYFLYSIGIILHVMCGAGVM
jgi:hypothetical protein